MGFPLSILTYLQYRLRHFMGRRAYFLIWALPFLVFFVRTTPRLLTDLRREKIPIPSPTSSMDRRLGPVLQLDKPSAALTQTFARLPSDCALIVVCPEDENDWKFVRYAIGYLTWPRKMEVVRLAPNETFAGVATEHTAMLFCGLPAPLGSNASRTTIGPKVVMLGPVKPK
jgi:hypothetical protein